MRGRRVAWAKDAPFGAEFAEVYFEASRLRAAGVAVGSAPLPYRIDYELETADSFATTRFFATVRADGWSRTLDLRRSPSNTWSLRRTEEGTPNDAVPSADGAAVDLQDALDVDLGLSPLFNTMPVLRHGLLRGSGAIDFVMAWVSVPDLAVHRSPQRYSFERILDEDRSVVRFDSLAGDGFVAEITYDAAGLVVDYPGIARRMA